MKNFFPFSLILLFILLIVGCSNSENPASNPVEEVDTSDPTMVQWPISRSYDPNSDISYAQYGPRSLPSGYDFHAGIDLPAQTGVSVYPVLPGQVVQVNPWDGVSTGAGNAITVKHSDTLATSYLHLHSILVTVGQQVTKSTVIGTVGATGASYPHLHLGYFLHLPNPNVRDERYSRNPLEILPHHSPESIPYEFKSSGEIVLTMPLQRMTANSIELIGESTSRKADYYEIVARGFTPRKQQVQSGIHFDAARRTSDHMWFDLTVKPENMDFIPERIIVRDYHGTILLDASRD